MNACSFTGGIVRCSLFFIFSFCFNFINGQTLNYTYDAGANEYLFRVNSLGTGDLVFYRFSDGYDTIIFSSAPNQQTIAKRKLLPGNPVTAIAYVAKKSGPLKITGSVTVNLNGASCPDCVFPNILSDNDYLRLRFAWLPYTSDQVQLSDNSFTPGLALPSQQWLFLIVTMKTKTGHEFAEVTLPSGMTYDKAIYKNVYGDNINYGSVTSITKPQPNKVKIQLDTKPDEELSVYLILKIGQSTAINNLFTATLNDVAQGQIDSDMLTLEKRVYPHDPNLLFSPDKIICPGQVQATPVKFRVDFYNAGEGSADRVEVLLKYDPMILDESTATLLDFSPVSNSALPSLSTPVPGFVHIILEEITLRGLREHPKPPLAETAGFVELQMTPKSCLVAPNSMAVNADVIFRAEPYFIEQTPTNEIMQHVLADSCSEPDIRCTSGGTGGGVGNNGSGTGGENTGRTDDAAAVQNKNIFEPVCYPTPFNDILRLEVQGWELSEMPLSIFIMDMNGKKWMSMNKTVGRDEIFKESIELSNLPGGMYLVHFNNGTHSTVKKVLKI